MRIAMVFDGLGVGGIERVGASYAELLVSAGHQVTLINLKPGSSEMLSRFPSSCECVEDRLGLPFQPDAFAALLKRPWGKYAFPLAYLAARGLLLLKKAAVRVRMRRSFDVAIAFSGHLSDLTYVAYGLAHAQWKMAWAHGSIREYLLLSYGFMHLYERIRTICVLSTEGQAEVMKDFPRLEARLSVQKIYNPIAQEPLSRDDAKVEELRVRYDEPMVMVGRFGSDKDQATVVRALKMLKERHGISKQLVFVGDGPTLGSCKELAVELGLGDVIHFVGSQPDVDPYLLAAAFAVHSSPAEGLPTVVLEAMRDGVPVLATNSLPGVPEIVGDSEYGLICKVGDAEDMADKMRMLLEDEPLRAHYAAQGKMRVRDFSPNAIGTQLSDILDALENA